MENVAWGEVVDCLRNRYEGIDDLTAQQVIGLMETLAILGAVGVWEQD